MKTMVVFGLGFLVGGVFYTKIYAKRLAMRDRELKGKIKYTLYEVGIDSEVVEGKINQIF